MKNNLSLLTNYVTKIFETNSKRTVINSKELIPGLIAKVGFTVSKQNKKADYLPVLKYLTSRGMSIKDASNLCGISYSYAAKLLHK